jgi:hypothetical protein
VTRLGEFSPNGGFLIFAFFLICSRPNKFYDNSITRILGLLFPRLWFCINFDKNVFGYILPNSSGVDVMITIFCDFGQLSPKKLAFFTKVNYLFRVKNAIFFAKKFGKSEKKS